MRRARRHFANLRASISRPSDAWLLIRMLGWSAVLPIAKVVLPLPRLVRIMGSARCEPRRDPLQEQTIAGLARWAFRSRPRRSRDNCLERALVTYRYLSRAGADPHLVVGLARPGHGAPGHAWVTVDGRAVHDDPEALRSYATILVFGPDGTIADPP